MFTNKKEKYGIRKFAVGTASIVLGSLLYGAVGESEAKASERITEATNGNRSINKPVLTAEKQNANKNENVIQPKVVNNVEQQSPSTVKENEKVDTSKPEALGKIEKQVETKVQEPMDTKPKPALITQEAEVKPQVKADGEKPKEVKPQQIQPSEQKASNLKPRAVTKKADKVQGKDVSSKVTVENESKIVNPNQTTQGNVVKPHNGQRLQLQYKWKFDKDIQPGDYFEFELSKNVNTGGVSIRRKVPDIKNGSLVMATGQVLNNGKIRYTFTDYIKDKVNVTASLNLNLFTDPKEIQNNGEQTVTAKLNGKTISAKVNIQYLNGTSHAGVGVNGVFETLDKENGKFSHVAYINTQGSSITSASVYGRITSGVKTNGQNPTVKIYEYIGEGNPPQSVYLDRENKSLWKDVTNEFKDKLTVSSGQYQLNFDKLDKRYAISYEGEYQNDAKDLNFQTHISGYPDYYGQYYAASATWNNGLVFFQNDANGNGQNGPIIENNDFTFDEDTGNGGTHGQNNGNQTIEEDTENDKPWHQEGGHNPIDWEEDTTPDGDSGHNNGETEEEDSHPIDWEEDTTPDGDSGHNNGETEEEDTMPPRPVPPTPEPQPEPKPVPPTPEPQPEPKPVPPTPEPQPEPKPVPPTPEPQPEPKPVPPTPEPQPEPKPVPPTPEPQPEPKPVPPTPEPQPEPKPVPPTPEPQPEPKPVPPTPEPQPMKSEGSSVSKTIEKTKAQKQMKELPNTGGETNKTTLLAGIFAVLGSLVLFRRNRQSK
ncbi:TPA: fibrinogen-binding adhesin SdrG C-terminal domain-containing protein [Staphylococcus aureus]|nr:YSIRK-type signal peptide-containing protein [Staphylococcus aureus]HDZ8768666.1 fibrinogen-binding adhesin SdrG C-terminal domain-containing protein [Staphylococcus aureus]